MSKAKSMRVNSADLDQVIADAAGLAASRLVELGGGDVADVNGGVFYGDITIATAGYLPPEEPGDFVGLGGIVVR